MKYITFLLFCLILACANVPLSNRKDLEYQIEIPIVLHFNEEYKPNIFTLVQTLNTTFSFYNSLGINLIISEVKIDSPRLAYYSTNKNDFLKLIKINDQRIHIFFVESIKDKKNKRTIGLTYLGGAKKYINISNDAAYTSTLAHEIGHYFGLSHNDKRNNLMFAERTEERQFIFTEQQIFKVRKIAIRDVL